MRKCKLDSKPLPCNLRGEPIYDYCVLVTERTSGPLSLESYGIEAVNRNTGDRACISDITVNISRIEALMELLAKNQVSPVHLRDVVDDWL